MANFLSQLFGNSFAQPDEGRSDALRGILGSDQFGTVLQALGSSLMRGPSNTPLALFSEDLERFQGMDLKQKAFQQEVAVSEEERARRAELAKYAVSIAPDNMKDLAHADPESFLNIWEKSKPKAGESYTLSPGEVRYGPNNEVIAEGAPDTKDAFGNEKDLYAQYAAADTVKAYETVKGGYERVRQSSALQSGAGDMGLIYGYMKMLDPGSVVRESEFEMAAQAGSYGEQIQGYVSRLANGERLPESVRQQFVAAADGIYQETAANLSDLNSQFTQRADTYQVDPGSFIRQPETYKPIGSDWADAGAGFRVREK